MPPEKKNRIQVGFHDTKTCHCLGCRAIRAQENPPKKEGKRGR